MKHIISKSFPITLYFVKVMQYFHALMLYHNSQGGHSKKNINTYCFLTTIAVIFISMQRNAFSKYICIAIFLCVTLTPVAFSQASETKAYNKYFSFGFGYQYFLWNYDIVRRFRTGYLEVIHQASQYHGMVFNTKFRMLRPWGLLASVNIYFPFSIEESVYLTQSETDAKVQVIKNGVYLLKNIPTLDVLKGIGVTSVVAANYIFESNAHLGNIGLGLSWVTFTEDLYGKDKQNRTSSMLGFMLDVDYQFSFSKLFGISFGTRLAYYPIALFSINNLVGAYSIRTTSMLEYFISFGPVFYF